MDIEHFIQFCFNLLDDEYGINTVSWRIIQDVLIGLNHPLALKILDNVKCCEGRWYLYKRK